MEKNIVDHSDSDSGDSWTILEPTPEYTEGVSQLSQNINERFPTVFKEKDEDTDGISVISDSDHESPAEHKNIDDNYTTEDEMLPDKQESTHVSVTPHITHFNENIDIDKASRDDNDYLMEGNGKLKTYVHRRNKRLSTVLNVIMLGSVITAAGVAIGHMWGAKNDCTMHHTPSVNKILSNLYKLQEENAYLRSKLKELTLMSNIQMHRKVPLKRCKKVFEEPLNSNNPNKLTKCIDDHTIEYEKVLESHLIEPSFEKEFLDDLNKLKNIYKQNKSWLDEEISKRMKQEKQQLKNDKKQIIPEKVQKHDQDKETMIKAEDTKILENYEKDNLMLSSQTFSIESLDDDQKELIDNKKISYADSLKSEKQNKIIQKREVDKKWGTEYINQINKKRLKKNFEPNLQDVTSEEEIKKDDRYNCHKCKYNRKKTEKWRRKQKGRSKHEQLDIKNLLKNYGDSQASPEYQNIVLDKNQAANDDTEKTKFENLDKLKEKTTKNLEKEEKVNWYEKRASLRKEYRNRLQQELFGEKGLNNSAWYFRRMKKREQCRAKASNDTHKKTSKLNMNFKTKQ